MWLKQSSVCATIKALVSTDINSCKWTTRTDFKLTFIYHFYVPMQIWISNMKRKSQRHVTISSINNFPIFFFISLLCRKIYLLLQFGKMTNYMLFGLTRLIFLSLFYFLSQCKMLWWHLNQFALVGYTSLTFHMQSDRFYQFYLLCHNPF